MKRNVFLCLSLVILSACNTVSIKIPKVEERLISAERNDAGEVTSMVCIVSMPNEEEAKIYPIEHCADTLGTSLQEYKKVYLFVEEISARLEVCLNYPRKCR